MKKILLISLLIGLGWATTLAQTEVYKKYALNPNIEASCVTNYIVNNTDTLEMTLLSTQDSATIELLKKDFNMKLKKTNAYRCECYYVDKNDFSKPAPLNANGKVDIQAAGFVIAKQFDMNTHLLIIVTNGPNGEEIYDKCFDNYFGGAIKDMYKKPDINNFNFIDTDNENSK